MGSSWATRICRAEHVWWDVGMMPANGLQVSYEFFTRTRSNPVNTARCESQSAETLIQDTVRRWIIDSTKISFDWMRFMTGTGKPRRGFTAPRSLEIDWILPPRRKLPPPTLNYECGDFSLNGKRQTCASLSEDIGLFVSLFCRLLAFYFFPIFIVFQN